MGCYEHTARAPFNVIVLLLFHCSCYIFAPVYLFQCILDVFMYGPFIIMISSLSCSAVHYIFDQSTSGLIHKHLCSIGLPSHMCAYFFIYKKAESRGHGGQWITVDPKLPFLKKKIKNKIIEFISYHHHL